MRVVIQRVISSSVTVDQKVVGQIGRGLNLLVGIATTDTKAEVEWMVKKCLDLKLFPAEIDDQLWQQSIIDIQGQLLVISQFTLYGNSRKGRRPSFSDSAPPAIAKPLYDQFVNQLKASSLTVETGIFGARMEVAIVNEGPVTLILERENEQAQE